MSRRPRSLVVVGGGVAGWTAATRALELGAEVTVLEKAAEGPGRGNGVYSGGVVHACYLSPKRPPDDLYDAIMRKTDGQAREDVARAWADNVGRALDYLSARGANFRPFGPAEFQQHQIGPGAAPVPDNVSSKRSTGGPFRLLATLWKAYEAAGGAFRPGRRALDLLTDGRRVAGVRAELAGGGHEDITADAVLIADGGFQANPALVARFITDAYALRGSDLDEGDGLQMGLAVGADITSMDAFYGFVLCRDALDDARFIRLREVGPQPLHLINAGIVVDGHGRRIANEDHGTEPWALIHEPLAAAIARSETPADCWVVFDDRAWNTAGRTKRATGADVPMNPGLVEAGGTLVSADSIAELASRANLPPALEDTVDAFNRFCAGDGALVPERTGAPAPILHAPFHAVPLIAGITYTMGGLLVNGAAQVLADGRPIPGLYAAGGAMGGLQGGPRNGYAGGWCEAFTFGLLAAEHVLAA